MKFLVNQKLAMRISILTTAITLTGMLLLWLIVSNNVAAIVKNDITNQMTDALLDLNMKGLPNSEYIFLNAKTGVYLYHQAEALLNAETKDRRYF
jgi:hypothetical protein